jgi:23S rRNA (cytidine1920-2'-O)/16S rRNA (cytidine1409-2'-O)-methyltransferase
MEKIRLDRWLVEHEGISSRARAQRLIREGEVKVGEEVVRETSRKVNEQSRVSVIGREKYVGRGGHKLEAALERSGIRVEGCSCLDVGASTGGFTDCLLQRGAGHVTAIDVGHGQLVSSLKSDARVELHEKCNARHLQPGHWGRFFSVLVVDVSFISLEKILQPVMAQADREAWLVLLVKPQFEVGPEHVGEGGLVREAGIRERALEKVRGLVEDALDWKVVGTMPCPVKGGDGNQEYLLWARKSAR